MHVVRAPSRHALTDLTARERELLALMAEGLTNAAIGERLWLSPKTVETHVRSIFAKLELPPDREQHRRVAAVLLYLDATAGPPATIVEPPVLVPERRVV